MVNFSSHAALLGRGIFHSIYAYVNENIYGDYLPAKDAHHKARTGHRHRPFESTSPELSCLTKIGFMSFHELSYH